MVIGADPAILNPNVSVGVPDVLTGCMLYDGLVRFAEGFRIVPSLAKRWEIAPDGLTYTFHLVTATWSDGKPLTSEDVKYRLVEVSAKYGSKFVAPGKAIKDIETPDADAAVEAVCTLPVLAGVRAERGNPAGTRLLRQRRPEASGVSRTARRRGAIPAHRVGARRPPHAGAQSRLLVQGSALP